MEEKVIDITAKRDGFYRCGIAHSDKTATYPVSRFTKSQLKQLQGEPMLIVAIRNKDDSPNMEQTEVTALKNEVSQYKKDIEALTQQLKDEQEKTAALTAELDAIKENPAEPEQEKAAAETKSSKAKKE